MVEPYRALIVDDEPSVRSRTVRAMSQEHFNCDEAADGDEAAAMCQREHSMSSMSYMLTTPMRLRRLLQSQEMPPWRSRYSSLLTAAFIIQAESELFLWNRLWFESARAVSANSL